LDRETRTNAFLDILDRIEDNKNSREEELGWDEAKAEVQGRLDWEKVEHTIEEELDVTEELIQ